MIRNFLLTMLLSMGVCFQAVAQNYQEVESWIQQLSPLYKTPGEPQPGEWRAVYDEPPQDLAQYIQTAPNRPDRERDVLYVITLGEVTTAQARIFKTSSEYLALFYGITLKELPAHSLDQIPDSARRGTSTEQFLTPFLLHQVLSPQLPADGFALLGFTAEDLYPAESWNYVFGQASLTDRVGVWSLHRYGDPAASDNSFQLALHRTMTTAIHETGHMFGLPHCIRFECAMAGSNSLEESDGHPDYFCPQCEAKICWNTQTDPRKRYRKLARFCETIGWEEMQDHYEKVLDLCPKRW